MVRKNPIQGYLQTEKAEFLLVRDAINSPCTHPLITAAAYFRLYPHRVNLLIN